MVQLPTEAVYAAALIIGLQTLIQAFVFGFFVWKNLSLVNGIPPEFARRRFDIEEQKLAMEKEAQRLTLQMRENAMARVQQQQEQQNGRMAKIEALGKKTGMPGMPSPEGFTFLNPEQ